MPAPTLTQEQIDSFHRSGYLRVGPVLEESELPALRAEYDRLFAEAIADKRIRNLAVADGDANKAVTAEMQMYQIMQVGERSLAFRKLLYDTRLLDMVQEILGPNIMLFHDQALFKPARTGGPVYWHQDNAYWRCKPANLISCWMTLDDVTRENGAMQVIPGSHLSPVWHGNAQTDPLLRAKVDASQAVVLDLPAGGVMFHHCQTLHYTEPNQTDRQRRAFAIHYMNPGTRGANGQVIKVGFGNPVLRMSV